jgi:predicted nucleic acid-binding Zn finger protein
MSVNRLFEKAKRLVESRRVEPLGQGVYNVIGDHGTYTVVQDYAGKLSCSCPGFMKKAKCSHVTAVIILTKMKKRQKPHQTKL